MAAVALFSAYAFLGVEALHKLGMWSRGQIKDTLVWWAFSGLGIAFSFGREASLKAGYWRRLAAEQFGLALLAEWVGSTFTLPLWGELVLVPVLFLVAGIQVVADSRPEHRAVSRLASCMVTCIGLGLFAWSVSAALQTLSFSDLPSVAQDIGTTVLLSLWAVPFGYALSSLVAFEDLLVSARFVVWPRRNERLARYLVWQLWKTGRGDRATMKRLWRIYLRNLSAAPSKEHIDSVIALAEARRRGVRPDGSVIPNPRLDVMDM